MTTEDTLTPEQSQLLDALAKSQTIDKSAALQQALEIAKVVVDTNQNKGERVLIQKGQQIQELTLEK